jgi:hypothetical protein
MLFQTNIDDYHEIDSSHFDLCSLKNVKFKNSRSEVFLQEDWVFDIGNNAYGKPLGKWLLMVMGMHIVTRRSL